MTYDLKGDDGELDREKVRAELRRIIDHDFQPDEDELMNLINQAINRAQVDTERQCRY